MKRSCLISTAALFSAVLLGAETPSTPSVPVLRFTATTANVAGAPDSIRIDLFRWSTDAEREKLMAAWNMKPEAAAPGGPGRGTGRGGRGAGRGGQGGAGGRGPVGEEAPPPTPEGRLANALKDAPTVGYLWSSEVAGYALRYAGKMTAADGSERIILITDRRLGAVNDLWKPAGQTPPAMYDFSVIELHLNAKGEGEGRISLTGKVAPDAAMGIVAPASYEALPVVLINVKRQIMPTHTGQSH